MPTVEFRKVGRSKKTWTADLPIINDARLHEAVVQSYTLMSHDISFTFSNDNSHGDVLVGGHHKVGTWEIITPIIPD